MISAGIVIDPAFRIGPVRRELFGSFVEHLGRCVYTGIYERTHPLADEDGFRTDVLELVRELGVTNVRYPGGSFVSAYSWEDGVGPKDQRPSRADIAWHSVEPNEFGLDEFIRWCRKADVEPMMTVNTGTRGLKSALEVLEYSNVPRGTALADARRANGAEAPHNIRTWCIGNELDHRYTIGFKTAEGYAQLAAEIDGAENVLARATVQIASARAGYASIAERIGAARRLASQAVSCSDAQAELSRAEKALETARGTLATALDSAGFAGAEAAAEARRDAADIAALESTISTADAQRAAAQGTLDDLADVQIPSEPVVVDAAEAALADARAARDAAVDERGAAEHLRADLAGSHERANAAHDEIRERAGEVDVIVRLADTVSGRAPNTRRMNLETFVLAAELEEIVRAANVRLAEMSDNRYTLRHTDSLAKRNAASGLGIEVFDAYSGRARPPQSLSGGETFLASLSLALGLSEVVTNRSGGIRLDTLFIDEGFGSLDAETLETAMRTLDDLRQGGRTVGLISHVEAMKEQISAQLRVRRAPGGWSVVEQ